MVLITNVPLPKKKPDTKGIIMPPIFDIEPQDYIIPILHLLIGIVNKGWTSFVHFLDEFVENVSKVEAELKDKNTKLKMNYLTLMMKWIFILYPKQWLWKL